MSGKAPVAPPLVAPGTQGLIIPDLSVGPVPIEALLAPVPALPESDDVAAIVVADDGCWSARVPVRLQAAVALGGMACAIAEAENAIPIASEAEKIKRDI